jgi:hypothetical protein
MLLFLVALNAKSSGRIAHGKAEDKGMGGKKLFRLDPRKMGK